jgi:hypothetical protein
LWWFRFWWWLPRDKWLCHLLSSLYRQITQNSFLFFPPFKNIFSSLFHWINARLNSMQMLTWKVLYFLIKGTQEQYASKKWQLEHYCLCRPAHNSAPTDFRKHHQVSKVITVMCLDMWPCHFITTYFCTNVYGFRHKIRMVIFDLSHSLSLSLSLSRPTHHICVRNLIQIATTDQWSLSKKFKNC